MTIKYKKAGISDHGELDGLGDDDHILYILADGTRALTGNWNAGAFFNHRSRYHRRHGHDFRPFAENNFWRGSYWGGYALLGWE